jgi:chloride channel protein, CIC family
VRLGDVAQESFTIARESDIIFDVVQRLTRRDAIMAIVVKDRSRGRPSDVVGIISKDQIADSVGASIKPFG